MEVKIKYFKSIANKLGAELNRLKVKYTNLKRINELNERKIRNLERENAALKRDNEYMERQLSRYH